MLLFVVFRYIHVIYFDPRTLYKGTTAHSAVANRFSRGPDVPPVIGSRRGHQNVKGPGLVRDGIRTFPTISISELISNVNL